MAMLNNQRVTSIQAVVRSQFCLVSYRGCSCNQRTSGRCCRSKCRPLHWSWSIAPWHAIPRVEINHNLEPNHIIYYWTIGCVQVPYTYTCIYIYVYMHIHGHTSTVHLHIYINIIHLSMHVFFLKKIFLYVLVLYHVQWMDRFDHDLTTMSLQWIDDPPRFGASAHHLLRGRLATLPSPNHWGDSWSDEKKRGEVYGGVKPK
jgi:hypothetical protein